MNAKTGLLKDNIEYDQLNHLPPPDDYVIDEVTCLPRCNKDKKVNTAGRRLIDLCQICDLRIVNGRVGKDNAIGDFTCVKHNGTSTVDYVLCSSTEINEMKLFEIMDSNEYSDHKPLVFNVNVKYKAQLREQKKEFSKLVWDDKRLKEFVTALNDGPCTNNFSNMMNIIENGQNDEQSVNQAVNFFVDGVRSAADPIFEKKIRNYPLKPSQKYVDSKPAWANDDWVAARHAFHKWKDRYNRSPTVTNKEQMVNARKVYKNISWGCRKKYDRDQTSKLLSARLNNAGEYWKI